MSTSKNGWRKIYLSGAIGERDIYFRGRSEGELQIARGLAEN
jgi:hypothetical protein